MYKDFYVLRSTLAFVLSTLLLSSGHAETLSYQPATAQPGYGYLPDDELHAIDVDGQAQQVLVRAWEGKHQYGAVILLANPGQVPDTPGLIAHLRRSLNPDGWASLNLTSPTPLPRASFSTTAESIAKAGEGQLELASVSATPGFTQQQMREFIEERQKSVTASLAQLDTIGSEYPGKRVLVVSNQTAAMVIELLHSKQMNTPDLLVVFNPFLPEKKSNSALVKALAELEIPVLDIQSPDGHPASRETLAQRSNLTRTKGPAKYRQLKLSLNLDLPSSWQHASKAIKGFAYTSLIR
ncbi:DUF3530 family protein [Shewanella submarina]|uniref:DUF3530 family protein n=1 Tax=Shewanella submarina TaxID=2016376 RepID=A0ABV7G5G9_9GAMM|nr:DUF3530 family protein [Shewanella submarina]